MATQKKRIPYADAPTRRGTHALVTYAKKPLWKKVKVMVTLRGLPSIREYLLDLVEKDVKKGPTKEELLATLGLVTKDTTRRPHTTRQTRRRARVSRTLSQQ